VTRREERALVQDELAALLQAGMADPGEILRLGSRLAELDDEHVWFSVSSGLVERLGAELVAREETAVAELIRVQFPVGRRFVSDSKGFGGGSRPSAA